MVKGYINCNENDVPIVHYSDFKYRKEDTNRISTIEMYICFE